MTALETLAQAFAAALDQERWEVALPMLAEDCQYDTPRGPIRGRDAILASYRSSAEKATRELDSIQYWSRLLPSPSGVKIEFVDELHRAGRVHVYTSWQTLWFEGERIVRILCEESLDERARLNAFLRGQDPTAGE